MSQVPAYSKIAWPDYRLGLDVAGSSSGSTFARCATSLALRESASIIFSALAAKIVYLDYYLGQPQEFLPYIIPAVILNFTLYLFFKQLGLYEINTLVDPVLGFGKIWGGLALSFLILLGTLYLLKTVEIYSRVWILAWFALSAAMLVTVRWTTMRRLRRNFADGRLRQRVALFGSADFVQSMKTHVEDSCPFSDIAGVYVADPDKAAGAVSGGLRELLEAMTRKRYERVMIGFPASDTKNIQAAVKSLASHSVELLLCTDLAPIPIGIQGSRTFGRLRSDIVSLVPSSESNRLVKSLLDYGAAAAGLLVLAPFLGLVALAIKLDSPGPVFFRQRRYGQNNRVFQIYKFRTMAVAEDGATVKQAERNDPRVTRVGRFLRSTSIDELPQLINVLTGDMSLVGPRPHALAHDQYFEQQLDLFSRRRRVRPGLTGWAQVNGFRGETKTTEAIRRRMEYDLYYIDNWSIWLDVEIIVRTLFVVGRGAY